MTRAEHLAWCKERALALLDAGRLEQAVTSMISDLRKWEKPLYDHQTMMTIAMAGIVFCKTSAEVRKWIGDFQ